MLPRERALELLQYSLPMIPTLNHDIVQDVLSRKRKLGISQICRLWAGMGSIYSVSIDGSAIFVVKHVIPPPSGDQSFGDQRKSHSYQVEANFYEHVAFELSSTVVLPAPFYVERGPKKNEVTICMSMLHGTSIDTSSREDVRATLRWLAQLHAAYWGKDTVSEVISKAKLQKTGSYWHLDTRPEEHDNMPSAGLQGRLKRAARAIDECLNRDSMQCLIHGDPKEANVMHLKKSEGGARIAMYDYQYCGQGTPTRDLAYFLCSSCHAAWESELVSYYYTQLHNELICKGKTPPDLDHLLKSLDLAFCDFYRFLCGWGQWGYDLEGKARSTMDRIDGGADLGSENSYRQALQREFW